MKTNTGSDSARTRPAEKMPVIPYALHKVRGLLENSRGRVEEVETHAVKSLLYAAVEQTRIKADELLSLQRMLRELFVIVTASGDLRDYERNVGLQILDELAARYGYKSTKP